MTKVFLSYIYHSFFPTYGCTLSDLGLQQIKSIPGGESCNVYSFQFQNHWGTHVDCPNHFFADGYKVCAVPAEQWVFNKPYVIEINCEVDSLLDVSTLTFIPQDADLLLIKTGWGKLRGSDNYSCHNPGFTPDVGFYLRRNYPNLQAIGFDFISLSPYQNRDIGRAAHRAFLDPNGVNHPVRIIEDMDLTVDLSNLRRVWVVPLRVAEIDSAPCTIIGEFDD